MVVKIGINGFGRIGRVTLRVALERKNYGTDFEIVAINDVAPIEVLSHLFRYDSTFGKFNGTVDCKKDHLLVNGKKIIFFNEKDPSKIPWKDVGAEVVIESTGIFTDRSGASAHLTAGAKKVIISAPAKEPDITLVLGVNENEYDANKHNIISNASCTTNSLAPVAKILHKEFGIVSGLMTTIHAYTGDQRLMDFPHKDLRRARAANLSIIPTTTGAAKAVGLVLPELKGKLNGTALRVPTPDGSITDFTAVLQRETTIEEINSTIKRYAEGELKGIVEYTEEPIVSVDVIKNPNSCIVDGKSTMVVPDGKGNVVKVFCWYDNEWGYSERLIDIIDFMYRKTERKIDAWATMDELNVKDKTVFLRIDVNSPLDRDTLEITDKTRFEASAQTINELAAKGAKVVILAHQGRPGDWDFTSMKKHAETMKQVIKRDVKFVDDVYGEKAIEAIKNLKNSEVLMLDNVRKVKDEMEKKSLEEFAKSDMIKALSPYGDIFINDAFATAHRAQCSLVGFTETLPSAVGRLMEKELKTLEKIFVLPEKPALFLFGGAKFEDSVKVIKNLLERNLGFVCLTGLTGNAFLRAKGIDLGEENNKKLESMGKEAFELAKTLIIKYKEKILLPDDVAIDHNGERKEIMVFALPTQYPILDIGGETVKKIKKYISEAKTIFFSGPPGVFEREDFAIGTRELFTSIALSKAFTLTGGGHTISALDKFGLRKNITYISTGGGALEEFLLGKELPVVAALKNAKQKWKDKYGS
ncbi:MAG: type I glyceraldehyde-3-phosphate dehydrogenase [Candidatus Thermoplasmatota archaeon]